MKEVYEFLVDYTKENGYAPSIREIGKGTGINSTASVSEQLRKLEIMGKIEIKSNSSRAIKLIGYELVKVG